MAKEYKSIVSPEQEPSDAITLPSHVAGSGSHDRLVDAARDYARAAASVSRDGKRAREMRLNDKHVARLIKACVLNAGLRPDLPDAERAKLYSGHSLRAGLASSAEADERYVQKQLGHASAEMTRRDRFRINLTKAAGL